MWVNAKLKFRVLFVLLGLIWAVEVVNFLSGHELNRYGILPGTTSGLYGILLSPFLHGSIHHTLMNSLPLVILGWLSFTRGVGKFVSVTLFIILAGGAAVWFVGRDAYHVGASGLIFGYFGYLISRGYFEKTISSVFISVVTVTLYGGLFFGVFPNKIGVSWEGHLFGFLAGIIAAWLFINKRKRVEPVDASK